MLNTIPTTKNSSLLTNALVAMRRLPTPTPTAGTGRHRGRPASERLASVGAPGMGAHRRPPAAPAPGGTAARD
ncbi:MULTISPECIES: hypothetical protein [unclassified Streptomyces]|uniref:hypothetical protein n=1 Tax=unclassified Streptomyces TaxID=2593676 RepID=UPI003D8BE487